MQKKNFLDLMPKSRKMLNVFFFKDLTKRNSFLQDIQLKFADTAKLYTYTHANRNIHPYTNISR